MKRRPAGVAGVSPGAAALGLAWVGGVLVAQLTGATAVLVVLAAGVVVWPLAAWGAWRAVRWGEVGSVSLAATSTAGTGVPARIELERVTGPVWVSVEAGGSLVGGGWSTTEPMTLTFDRRGPIVALAVTVRSSGRLGLVWWRRTRIVAVDHLVAPAAAPGPVAVERREVHGNGESGGAPGALAGDVDGVRPWREGDSERSVHWATSVRAGELVVHDRRRTADRVTVIRAAPGTADPEAEAAAARYALDAALTAGDQVWAAVDDADPVPIADQAAAARWTALAELGPASVAAPPPGRPRRHLEPERTARVTARWWAAAATAVSVLMLCGALGYGWSITVPALAGIAAGAGVTARVIASGAPSPGWTRVLAAVGAAAGLAGVIVALGPMQGLFGVLRGPLPQLLLVLIVLHGFECRDRRTLRVALAVSAVVVMYASGFRVDGRLGWWLLAWAVCAGMALTDLAGPTSGTRVPEVGVDLGGWARRALAGGVAALGALGSLALVPVPAGPARLTLPSLLDQSRPVDAPGAIAGPDGTARTGAPDGSGGRSRSPQAGDYTGFADQLDTNVRGALSDEIVMRVRAPAPDFWRGQTFDTFDGRVWHADPAPGDHRQGPEVYVEPAFGDRRSGSRYDLAADEFVQTFFVEADMPNVVFHAYRPVQLMVDADVWVRPDGAIRAATSFPAGTVYTVVSSRRPVTAADLRASGDVAERLTPIGRDAFARYLDVPASTSAATRELAAELAEGQPSTYDVVLAYQEWIGTHVEYDLDAPLPAEGADAVDDLLFGSRRGFCEQIASALVVMLRAQGVPARLATGYLPGSRDRLTGVWEVRGSDAHAWAEVWFPEVGWQAFDPTAEVPLAGDSTPRSVGVELVAGIGRWVSARPAAAALAVAVPVALALAWRAAARLRHRHRRGRWGLLQDRFAERSGARPGATNTARAASWTVPDDALRAHEIARRLDASVFDPDWCDTDADYTETRQLVDALGRAGPRIPVE